MMTCVNSFRLGGAIVGAVANDKDDRKPQTLLLKGSDEVVVRDAEVGAVVVRLAEVVQIPSRWLSEHLPGSLRWLASFEWIVPVGAGFTMIQVEEYAFATACWAASLLVIVAKVITWKGWATRRALTFLTRLTLCLTAVAVFGLAIVWTTAKRADRPWSAL